MFSKVKQLFFTQTGKDTSITFIGTIVNAFFGAIFFVVVPRLLGPQQYGLFAVVTSTGVMAAGLTSLGIDTGILRFIKDGEEENNHRILKLAFQSFLAIGLAVFALGFFISAPLANILQNPSLRPLLTIAFSGVIFLLLTDFFVVTLQSRKKYAEASLVNIMSNIARLLILALAAFFFTINVYFLTALFFFVTIISVIVGKIFVPLDFLKAKNQGKNFKSFFTYNSWVAASLAISSIPFDNYILIKYAGPLSTGLYAAPFKLFNIIDQLAGNFSRVLATRFASFETDHKAIQFTKKSLPFVILMTVALIVSIFLAPWIVDLLLGSKYQSSVYIFKIIAIGSIFTFATAIPSSIINYYHGDSRATFIITLLVIGLWVLSCIILIPRFHETGAAFAFLTGEISAFVFFTVYTFILLRK